ncbi:MAG: hypothetical protein Q9209_006649 [Squamulea sp. 1 TL-2023]
MSELCMGNHLLETHHLLSLMTIGYGRDKEVAKNKSLTTDQLLRTCRKRNRRNLGHLRLSGMISAIAFQDQRKSLHFNFRKLSIPKCTRGFAKEREISWCCAHTGYSSVLLKEDALWKQAVDDPLDGSTMHDIPPSNNRQKRQRQTTERDRANGLGQAPTTEPPTSARRPRGRPKDADSKAAKAATKAQTIVEVKRRSTSTGIARGK